MTQLYKIAPEQLALLCAMYAFSPTRKRCRSANEVKVNYLLLFPYVIWNKQLEAMTKNGFLSKIMSRGTSTYRITKLGKSVVRAKTEPDKQRIIDALLRNAETGEIQSDSTISPNSTDGHDQGVPDSYTAQPVRQEG